VEEATRQDYSNSEKYAKFSKAGLVVVDHAWIFSIQDTLNNPAELYFNDLPEGYVKDEELAKQIGMKIPLSQDSVSSLANALGIDVDDIEYLKNNREKFKEFKRLNESKYEAKRPKADSYDRGRRDDIISEEIITAPPIERKERSRTIRVSKPSLRPEIREYLRDVNTNEYDELICQFCHEVMPFKIADGYYFEAVELVWDLEKELIQNHLALCPNCAAKYEHANPYNSQQIENMIFSATGLEIDFTLAEHKISVWFTKKHIDDLRTVLSFIKNGA
jgi:hypothetical protein